MWNLHEDNINAYRDYFMCSNPSAATALVSGSVEPQSSQVGVSKKKAGIGNTECSISPVLYRKEFMAAQGEEQQAPGSCLPVFGKPGKLCSSLS